MSRRLLEPFVLVAVSLIGLLVFVCLNHGRVHAVSWIHAGAAANLGELLATGSVADYVPVGQRRVSPGDLYLSVGIGLLALGAMKVVYDGCAR